MNSFFRLATLSKVARQFGREKMMMIYFAPETQKWELWYLHAKVDPLDPVNNFSWTVFFTFWKPLDLEVPKSILGVVSLET